MMKVSGVKKLVAIALIGILVLLAGCQSIGGLDFQKVIENSLKVTSSESSQTLSLELVPSAGATKEDAEIIRLINSFKLNIEHAKMQDRQHMSLQGKITYGEKAVPFRIVLDGMKYTVWIDGVKKPIVIDALASGGKLDAAFVKEAEKLQTNLDGVSTSLVSFLVKHAPVPQTIAVSSVTENVYGQSTNLTKLHVEIKGDEIIGFVKTLLTNIAQDDKGLRELTSALYEAFYPLIEQAMGTSLAGMNEDNFFASIFKDKEVGSLVAYKLIKKALDEAVANYDQQVEGMVKSLDGADQVLSKNTSLNLDFYIDSERQIRKQNMELTVALPKDSGAPIEKLILRASAETWNMNKPVKADTIDTSAGVFPLDFVDASGIKLLSNFDKNSVAYDILKNEWKVSSKNFPMYRASELNDWDDYSYWIQHKTGMVSLSYIALELGADVEWGDETQEIKVYSPYNDTHIELKVGSKTATVNGTTVTLPEPVVADELGSAHVPLRFIVGALGAELKETPGSDDFYIVRD